MGYSYFEEAGPKMCFNAAKLWQLGWNNNRHLTLSSSNPNYTGNIAGFIDNPDTPGSPMIIKIDDPSGEDYFINFNVKAGFNSGTIEGGNEVLVIRAGDGINYSESQLKAKLGAGSSYTVQDFDNGKTLKVEVNSINVQDRIANVRICIGECPPACSSDAQCDDSDDCTTDVCVEGGCTNSRIESEQCSACPGERVVDLRVLTDNYPKETSWKLYNTCADTVEAQGGNYDVANTEYATGKICVPIGAYEFIIEDSYGDGICCNYGYGSFSIDYNGNPVTIEPDRFSFGSSETIKFGELCKFESPSPTITWSKSPTAQPSVKPSQSPSAKPSKSPTAKPSVKPSQSPSANPSKVPSAQPSFAPTPIFLSPDIPWCGSTNCSCTEFCKGIAEDNSRCGESDIKYRCPVTCGSKCYCYDLDSFEHEGEQKNCAWVSRRNKCTESKLRALCPKTCGDCA
jgi:hypothetical protein